MNKKELTKELREAYQEIDRLQARVGYGRITFDLQHWSDAELDWISAKAVAATLCSTLFDDGNKADSDTAYAIVRLCESAEAWMDSGCYR